MGLFGKKNGKSLHFFRVDNPGCSRPRSGNLAVRLSAVSRVTFVAMVESTLLKSLHRFSSITLPRSMGGGGVKSSQGDDRALHSLFAEKPRRVEYRNRKRFLDVLHEGLSRFVGKTYRCIHQAVPEFHLFATFFSCTFGLARLCCYFDLLPPLNVFG